MAAVRRTLTARAPSSEVLAAIIAAAVAERADDDTIEPGRLHGDDARRVLSANSTENVAVAVARHCTDQGVLAELTRRAVTTAGMHHLVRALLASPAIDVFDAVELVMMADVGASFHKDRVIELVNAVAPTPELFAHAARLGCTEALSAIAAHCDLGADTALMIARHTELGRSEGHQFISHMTVAPLVAFSRPTAGAPETIEQLRSSLRELLTSCTASLHYFDRSASFGHKVFNRLAEADGLSLGEEFLDEQIADTLFGHIDGRRALLNRTDTPPVACRWLWNSVSFLPRDTGTDQFVDKLANLPGCPDDVLDALPADAGGGVALARRLPDDPVAWRLALVALEGVGDRDKVPSVGELCDVAIVVASRN